MIIRVDAHEAMPVYEQIRVQVTRMVVAGTIEAGARMPTIRQLANDLRLAKGTVAKAYALLEESRIVESRGHKGTFVSAHSEVVAVDASALADAAAAFATTARQLGSSEAAAIAAVRDQWIHD